MKVVYIAWLDASNCDGVRTAKVARAETLIEVHTAGLLIGEDDEVVRVGQDYWNYEDSDGTVPEIYRQIKVIPKGAIQRRLDWETDNNQGSRSIEATVPVGSEGWRRGYRDEILPLREASKRETVDDQG